MSENRFFRQSLPQRRVVVTGLGALSPIGDDAESSFNNALNGKSGITKISKFDASNLNVQIAGEVKNFDATKYNITSKDARKLDTFTQYAIACSYMAKEQSGLEITDAMSQRIGCIIGVGMGGLGFIEEQYKTALERGHSRITPFFIPKVISNMAAGQVSMLFNLKGANYCTTSACASGAHAIGEAARYIRDGLADAMFAGGVESTVCSLAIAGFSNMKALSTRNSSPEQASRPWDKQRDGFVLGEGCGMLILESYESASRRGANILAEITGYGATSDAHHMTSPAPEGEGGHRAMKLALMDAGLNPEQLDYVNAHGTSTPNGDPLESIAIENLVGDHKSKIWVSSTKSMTGHLLGGAGALESVFSVQSILKKAVPPTINLEEPDDDCRLDYIPLNAREKELKHVLNNSFGFGGTNVSLIFSQLEN